MTLNPVEHLLQYDKFEALLEQMCNNPTSDKKENITKELYTYMKDSLKTNDQLNESVSTTFQLLMMDQEGYIIYIDDQFCKQLGYKGEELLHHHYRILHAGVHDALFYENMWSTVNAGEVWEGDICTATKNGMMIWYRTKIIPVVDKMNNYTTFTVFRTDISDVKHEDKLLVETLNDDYRKVFGQLMNLIFRVQKQKETEAYRFRMIEGKLAKKMNITSNNTYGEPLEAVFSGLDDRRINAYFDQVFLGEELTFKHQHGSMYLYTMLSPIFENGEVIEVIGSSIDITSLEKAEQKVRELAFYDPLTNLPNRTKLREDLKLDIEKSDGNAFAVLYCDIDRLKHINDTLGEFIGDQVIQTIAKRLEKIMADNGALYRFGGDEFIATMTGSQKEIDYIGEKMLAEIKQPITLHGNEFFVTSSIGVSCFGVDAWTEEELINHASVAVHYCKVSGRNNKLFYTPDMNEMYNDILLLEGEIRKALHHDEFELYYQPQINVATGEVIGLEALIRWDHPERGFIPPTKFIPLAEESGLINQIGEWVIREACMQHVAWVSQGHDPVRIAVNVSAIELQRFDFADQVAQIMADTKMDPRFLEIEITENSVMQNTEDCIKTMNTLQHMGVTLSIDDFGTGYSSFGYLRKFPINFLKIDQSFVRDALIEPSSAEIVKAMIQLAHTFGLKVVAEGVEEEDILELLQGQNCDYYQGYFFSKPVPACELESVIYGKMA